MSLIDVYQMESPSEDIFWRSIILFGANTASYKFALSKSLIQFINQNKTVITLEELADPFSEYICEHLKKAPRQATNSSSSFLSACSDFNNGTLSKADLLVTTTKLGFRHVLDAFHNVNGGEVPIKFFEKDFEGRKKNIILTDEIYKLGNKEMLDNLVKETEARWRLVETAWQISEKIGLAGNLLNINYDNEDASLFIDEKLKRRNVTTARAALNGYQKGKCFYCYDDISINNEDNNLCDVDHFFPHTLNHYSAFNSVNLNGVWNLVLAGKNCNRGTNGKFASLPDIKYLERLHKRNEFLINSHHPLRETLMRQTGNTEGDRIHFLRNVYEHAKVLGCVWNVEQRGKAIF